MNEIVGSEKIGISELIYLAYFAIMLFARGIGLYEGMTLYNISLVIGMLLFGLKILSTKHTVYEYLWMGALLSLSLLVYRNTGEKGLLVYTTMMLGLKGVSMIRVFRTGLIVWAVAFVSLVVLTVSKIIPERIYMHNKNGIGYLICHSLGYSHSNVLHISFIVLMIFIVYNVGRVDFKKLMVLTAALMVGNIYIFMYSVSYTGFIGATFFLILNLYFQLRSRITKVETILIQMIFPICVIFSAMGPILIKGKLFDLINKALNTRFYLSNYFLTQQPITLFGSRLVVPNYRYTMDCSYVYALVQLGIIPFALICILFFMLIRKCLKDDRRIELAIILGLCVAGVAEPFMFTLSYKNLIFLFAGVYLFELFDGIFLKSSKFFHTSVLVFNFGKKEICVRENSLYSKIKLNIRKTAKDKHIVIRWICIEIVTVLFIAITLLLIFPRPQHVYIDEDTNENMELEPTYFTQQEIDLIEEQGNIVFNYSDDKSPMYEYSGSTALIEYFRKLVSVCLAIGIIVGIGYFSFILIKQRRTLGETD